MLPRSILAVAALVAFSLQGFAAPITIDLSGATTGTSINTPQASFAQAFSGQTVSGTSLLGAPTNPLSLSPSGTIQVQFFDPGVSPASNSLLSQPGNAAPLAVLLASNADSLTFTSGSASPPSSFTLTFYNANGGLVNTVVQPTSSGYSVYNFSGFGTFRGFTISNNNDAAGLRFQNITYNSVATTVPEPASLTTFALMLVLLFAVGRIAVRRRAAMI